MSALVIVKTDRDLERRSKAYRYLFYLVSNVRFKRYRTWLREGEPNPFVGKTYRKVQTERVEFDDIFEDIFDRDH